MVGNLPLEEFANGNLLFQGNFFECEPSDEGISALD